jgi:hypothetical protein
MTLGLVQVDNCLSCYSIGYLWKSLRAESHQASFAQQGSPVGSSAANPTTDTDGQWQQASPSAEADGVGPRSRLQAWPSTRESSARMLCMSITPAGLFWGLSAAFALFISYFHVATSKVGSCIRDFFAFDVFDSWSLCIFTGLQC